MKSELERLIADALTSLTGSVLPDAADASWISVDRARDASHGDYTSNIALRLAKSARRAPRDLAAAIIAALPASPLLVRTEVAGAGFINFFLTDAAYAREIAGVLGQGEAYGRSNLGAGKRVQVEFVSVNPTGPLHVAHGRHAAFGATLSNILQAAGYQVAREYYINDAGNQIDTLARSVHLRYRELFGETIQMPEDSYPGEYVTDIAAALRKEHGDRFRAAPESEWLRPFGDFAVARVLETTGIAVDAQPDDWKHDVR